MTTPRDNRWKSKYKKSDHKDAKRSLQKEKNDRYQIRTRAIRLIPKYGIEAVAELFGISIRTIQRWLERFQKEGLSGLKDKSKRPHNICRLPEEVVNLVITLRIRFWEGCEKIALNTGISPRTVHKILKKAGLIIDRKGKRRWRHFQRKHSNSLWQMDFTMIYEDLWLLLIIDDHSRFIIGWKTMYSPNVDDSLDLLQDCFGKYGVPKQILTDHGTQFYAVRGGVSTFDLFCLENYIKHILASVKHPQTNGKVERKIGIVKEFLERKGHLSARAPNEDIERDIEEFVEYHNYSRFHFAYERYSFGDIQVKRKVHFLPYLRFVCHMA